MKNENGSRVATLDEPVEKNLVDLLKEKRAQIANDAKRKLRKLDREIELLEGSKAEELVSEARAVLAEM